ncbi:MAG: hypothetical protein P8Z30_08395 [Acidobacteriota bacterium]
MNSGEEPGCWATKGVKCDQFPRPSASAQTTTSVSAPIFSQVSDCRKPAPSRVARMLIAASTRMAAIPSTFCSVGEMWVTEAV